MTDWLSRRSRDLKAPDRKDWLGAFSQVTETVPGACSAHTFTTGVINSLKYAAPLHMAGTKGLINVPPIFFVFWSHFQPLPISKNIYTVLDIHFNKVLIEVIFYSSGYWWVGKSTPVLLVQRSRKFRELLVHPHSTSTISTSIGSSHLPTTK